MKSMIYLDCSYSGFRLQTSTGLSIEPSKWSINKAFPKAAISNYHAYREHLERVKDIVERFILEEQMKGQIPHPNTVKKELEKKINQKETANDGRPNFVRYYDDYLQIKSAEVSPRTMMILKACLKELVEFFATTNTELTFENINGDFFERYKIYLLNKKSDNANRKSEIGLLNDTIIKRIAKIKIYMKWAEERGLHKNRDYINFRYTKPHKNEQVVLSIDEFKKIRDLDLSKNVRLQRVQDLFLFATYTGQRWSDIERFNSKDLVNGDTWKFVAYKTKIKEISVPLTGFSKGALDILKKYKYILPKITGQKFNVYLKELGKLAGINEEIVIKRFSGKITIPIIKQKYELMTSHMARRTFVTIMLSHGVSHTTVMKITGHSDIKTLLVYENTQMDEIRASLNKVSV